MGQEQLFHRASISLGCSWKAWLAFNIASSLSWISRPEKQVILIERTLQKHSLTEFITTSYLWKIGNELGVSEGLVVPHVGIESSCIYQEGLNMTQIHICFSTTVVLRVPYVASGARPLTWYSSELRPAAVATCSSCAGVCFLKILCSKTKMSADSGEVCSSTARPPYLKQHAPPGQSCLCLF